MSIIKSHNMALGIMVWTLTTISHFQFPNPHSPFPIPHFSSIHLTYRTFRSGFAIITSFTLIPLYPFLLFYCEVIFTIKKICKNNCKKFFLKKLGLLCWNSTCSGRSFPKRFSFSNDVRLFKGSSCLTELFLGFNFSISMRLKYSFTSIFVWSYAIYRKYLCKYTVRSTFFSNVNLKTYFNFRTLWYF